MTGRGVSMTSRIKVEVGMSREGKGDESEG